MVRDEVFVHLDRGHPRLAFVRDARLAADTHDEIVMVHTIDQVRECVRQHLCVSVDLSFPRVR